MKKILPIIIVFVGVIGGAAIGVFMKPTNEESGASVAERGIDDTKSEETDATERNYVKIGRQTIVPVVESGETRALMLFELAVDVPAAQSSTVHEVEPRLRDAFLRELFRMSHTGAFMQNFTDERVIEELRHSLTRAAREHLGDTVKEVLILDVMRQEL